MNDNNSEAVLRKQAAWDLRTLINHYWDLAYQEGKEGRSTDTHAGEAQATSQAIDAAIAALSARPVAADKPFEQPEAGEKVMPQMRGYRMKCCDCGLVHVANFEVVEVLHPNDDGTYATDIPDNADKLRVVWSMTRELAAPAPAQQAVDDWIAADKELPPLETPVMCRFDDAEDSYVWAMMRTDDSDGWLWAMHQRGALTDVDSYEADDDYLVRWWHPFPALQPAPAEQGEGA